MSRLLAALAAMTFLAGCPWLDPAQILCATDVDCISGFACSGSSAEALGSCVDPNGDDPFSTPIQPVSGLDLVGMSVNQGVEIRMLDGSDWIDDRNAPMVAGRAGVLRLYVEPQDDWEPRQVLARLEFDDGRVLDVEEAVSNDTSEVGDLGSTINFDLVGEDVVAGVQFSVSLLETAEHAGESFGGTDDAYRWPREGDEAFGARTSGIVDLRIIPVRYNADGSGRLPDTSDDAMGLVRDHMMALYPASEVRVTVESPMDWSANVWPNGAGWSELLQGIYAVRDQRNMPGDSYSYGLFAPATTRGEFCGGGCVAGLSIAVMDPSWSDSRVSIGLGYGDLSSVETMAHEIGHAHGREHAPCGGAGNPDPSYPYANARLGVWGYDINDGRLKDPEQYADVMAYCQPNWVSDYTWNGLRDRIRAVGPEERFIGTPEAVETMSVIVDGDGVHSPKLQPGAFRFVPGGDVVKVLDADGFLLQESDARFLPFDHVDGGLLVFPAPPEGARAVDVPGFGVMIL
jgi:hypothetical protein